MRTDEKNKTIKQGKLVLVAVIAVLSVATFAYATDYVSGKTKTEVKEDKDGDYVKKTSSESEDADGTKTSIESEVEVDVDDDGDYKKTIESKTVTDPKGLMNKEVVKTKEELESDDGEDSYKYKKTVNGDTVIDGKIKAE